jgi:hypothetical protein
MKNTITNFYQRDEFWSEKTRLKSFATEWFNEEMKKAMLNFEIFRGKHVLEIGPGIGRQFDVIRPYTKTYSIADISWKNINLPIFEGSDKFPVSKYILYQYGDLRHKWEVIHFWFVIHHILHDEIHKFIDFIYRHIMDNGYVIFNAPIADTGGDRFKEDGMSTTPWKNGELDEYFHFAGFSRPVPIIRFDNNELYIFNKDVL